MQQASAGQQMRNALCNCGSGEKYKRCCGAVGARPQAPGAMGASPDKHDAQRQFLRAVQLLKSGQLAAAMSMLAAVIESDRNHFDAYHALGSALMQCGRFADASAILYQAVALRPDSAAAHCDLGAAYDNQNLHEQAIAAFRRAVELSPRLADVQLRLGQLYAMYSRMEEASDCFDRAADVKPKTTAARLYRADAQLMRGNIAAAEEWARKAVTLEPTSSDAQGALGALLYNQGRFAEATTCFETSLRLNPKAARSWDGVVRCRKYTATDSAIVDRMGAVLRRNDLHDFERMTIHFSMGKVYDDCGDYARAMEQFDAANRLRAKDLDFDRAGLAATVDRAIEIFTPEFMARNAASGDADPTPLFIVGMYRSGTTLVEQIVSSHPDVAAGGELTVWAPTDIEIDAATGAFDRERTQAAVAKYLAALRKIGPNAARITDKLPPNLFRLGAIHTLLPRARIIHCQRDPIDTCLSIYSTLFNTRIPYAARKEDLVFFYRQYLRVMDHWRKTLPPDIFLEVQYEQLVADREAETRRLIAFAGLDWNDSCLQPEQNKRAISTSSAWQVRQPVYTTSLRRWQRYEPWIGPLRQLLAAGT
ncbi:MAG TPA: sulfotransferase [Acetobacteraceae bacterium]|nr:sulfotransferase [Acetobacteraceae bacterium]